MYNDKLEESNYMNNSCTHKTEFIEYLQIEKNAAQNTVIHYKKDIDEFLSFLKEESIPALHEVDVQLARLFLTSLYRRKLSRRSVSRKISSLRSLFKFLQRENIVENNPFAQITLPKTKDTIPEFLYRQEIERLFTVNDLSTPLGQRNQDLLEILYGTRSEERRVGKDCRTRVW